MLFAKNLDYSLFTDKTDSEFARLVPKIASLGAQMFTEMLAKRLHMRIGATYVVDKKVSDDLSHTDFEDSKFEDLVWPSKSIEFNFEDPNIGTALVCHLKRAEVQEEGDRINVTLAGFNSRPDHEHQLTVLCEPADHNGTCIMVH